MIYNKQQLESLPRHQLVDLLLIMQESDRRIFAATILGSLIQTDSSTPMNMLVTEAISAADLLIEELNEKK